MTYSGHIERRSNSSYMIVIDLGRVKGKRKRINRSVKGNEKEAKKALRDLLLELEMGTYVKPQKMTVGEWLKDWLGTYGLTKLAESTRESYERIINKHLIPEIGHIPLTDLDALTIDNYSANKIKSGLSRRTAEYHFAVLRRALQCAVKKGGLIAVNACHKADAPIPDDPEIELYGYDEIVRLMDAETPDHVLIMIALFSGLRRSELLGLKWSDIDWDEDNPSFAVVRQVQVVKNKLVNKNTPKGGKRARRRVAIPRFLLPVLKDHHKEQTTLALMHGRQDYNKDNLVFPRLDGTPERGSNISHRFKNLVDKLGLPGMRLHDCRHFLATIMLDMDIDQTKVGDQMGWAKASTGKMAGRYQHLTKAMNRDAASRVEGFYDLLKNRPKKKKADDTKEGRQQK